MYKELLETNHRPYPLPSSKWVMTQEWKDLLFMHWPLPPDLIKKHIPSELELDTFDGNAWISILPFKIAETFTIRSGNYTRHKHMFIETAWLSFCRVHILIKHPFFTISSHRKSFSGR
ncbi:DUF2071 domain-containing protein [Bacillus songklensis]|uniref:DUF2071 domain-containing protein n=1 Tax=Bacillus songklensis TaxID=1069116 RepID=A0ABV8B7L1_9BACI